MRAGWVTKSQDLFTFQVTDCMQNYEKCVGPSVVETARSVMLQSVKALASVIDFDPNQCRSKRSSADSLAVAKTAMASLAIGALLLVHIIHM